jgi:hypothetical protein
LKLYLAQLHKELVLAKLKLNKLEVMADSYLRALAFDFVEIKQAK